MCDIARGLIGDPHNYFERRESPCLKMLLYKEGAQDLMHIPNKTSLGTLLFYEI